MTALVLPRRKRIPDSVKLAVALRALGHKDERGIDWSHEPALQLRAINDDGTDYKPGQLDPDYIFIRPKPEHAKITFKDNGTGRGDISAIAHTRRVTRKHDEHIARMQSKLGMSAAPAPKPRKRQWPKRKFQRRRP